MTDTTQAAPQVGHTPTPWHQEALMGRGPNNEAVFHCGLGIRSPADVREQEANAAFIVRAANDNAELDRLREERAEMLAALKDALPYIEAVALNATGREKQRNYRGCTNRISKAIARAEGRQS